MNTMETALLWNNMHILNGRKSHIRFIIWWRIRNHIFVDLHVIRLVNIRLLTCHVIWDWPANNQWYLHCELNPTRYRHVNTNHRIIKSKTGKVLINVNSSWTKFLFIAEAVFGSKSKMRWNRSLELMTTWPGINAHASWKHTINIWKSKPNLIMQTRQPDAKSSPTWLGSSSHVSWNQSQPDLDVIETHLGTKSSQQRRGRRCRCHHHPYKHHHHHARGHLWFGYFTLLVEPTFNWKWSSGWNMKC